MIPPFDRRGSLPPGIHKTDWNGGTRFLDYFQRERITGLAKGVVQIDLETAL